jgi:hypothetical protein
MDATCFPPHIRGRPQVSRLIGAILCLAYLGSAAAGAKVFVFYPSLARPLAIQDALAKKCPELDITVFGRLTDLQALVEREHPQAILAQADVLKQFPAYQPKLQGTRKGSATEDFVLLSIDKPFDMAKLSSSSIGVVGLLDRKEMDGFVAGLVSGAPRLNRVTKVEDLLPLLIFQSVSAVLVSEANMREFRKKSQANLVEVKLEKAKVGLVAAGVMEGSADAAKKILPSLQTLDANTLAMLGVDAWK